MAVTTDDIRGGLRRLGLSSMPVCVHSSLRSFGMVEGGAQAVVDGILAEGCSVLVPSFSVEAFEVPPPAGVHLARNGFGDSEPDASGPKGVYSRDSTEIDSDMGAVPTAVLSMAGHVRSPHPTRSFAAIGPQAGDLIPDSPEIELFGPLDRLADLDGWLLLMGVGLNRMTAIHLAEQRAGRRMFRRWANEPDRRPVELEVGGCSEGFPRFELIVKSLGRTTNVGPSLWCAYPSKELLEAASGAIQREPSLTHCGDPHCVRCNDAVEGGPVLAADGGAQVRPAGGSP